ncbi:Sec7-domain-containing protein [Metschnikowia bicuspidata var. bicuspidata NRRL YB-4993]|uniref:Sec7-domain-containing protein n=1 Tax=Metschnikowia bicuspidata var. bicuspidata NRRL YB-4993 TaxID=869754 RepID=A0A1A0HJM2_9ASCO|nr:Sec7-domain-containing protein [Metschnikowia bicuspidata var. bicuspidata NRRL YB-4993]OBA24087.1 Sec7-domain-containing protein [Metschnikowia bicuspidata var. bicuspidata NRRL YB-4993]
MIEECMRISLAMRKQGRWPSTGVAAVFAAADFYGDDEPLVTPPLHTRATGTMGSGTGGPLHASFLQLRAILAETVDIHAVDSLTLLQPFLLTIELSQTLGGVTALALDVVSRILRYQIVSPHLRNAAALLGQLTTSLTRCRFEASDQNRDDAILLKVLRLLETIVVGPLSSLLSNSVVSEVIQTCVSLACNKRRSEVLRRAAEMATAAMTVRIFLRVRELEPEPSNGEDMAPNFVDLLGPLHVTAPDLDTVEHSHDHTADQTHEISQTSPNRGSEELLAADTVNLAPLSPRKIPVNDIHELEQFDIQCINEFLGLLISMSSPANQYQHMESSRVFALSLINIAVEVAGDQIPRHPSLMALLADPVSKDVLQIISSTDSVPLLLEALRLFCTMAVVLNNNLKAQIELTLNLIFKSLLPNKSTIDKNIKGNATSISFRGPISKELIVESLSFLWTRSPQFFAQLFVEYDCDSEKSDLANTFVDFLCELALPESAITTTDNVPPICLEGILSFVSGINTRAKSLPSHRANCSGKHQLIANKLQKNSFIKCTELFNENPKKGIVALVEEKFINDANDAVEMAQFFFQKSARLNKKVLGEFLAKPTNSEILKEFMLLFDFGGLRVDEGLRIMLKSFRLPGESQQIERIVELFAEAFVASQTTENNVAPDEHPDREPVLPDRDAVFILSYSIIMLNTDLHNPQVKKLMDLEAYRRNLKGVYNGKDFPEWYMVCIYNSIRDREIIMPEEHHGTDKWFDDVWHNLISSQSNWARDHGNSVDDFDSDTLCDFDKLLFESVVKKVVSTLIQVFKEASDDSIITKLMSSIDKCANICIIYNLEPAANHMINLLSKLTTLCHDSTLKSPEDDQFRVEIPITQLKIEQKPDPITVSELSVYFGKDFKAQLSTVVLFRLIKKPNCRVSDSWNSVIRLILNLFENCLIEPNLFGDFQKRLKLPPLTKVKPSFVIQKVKPLKESGLLSTFSSFLKSYSDEAPEPSDQEIESTLSTIDCVQSLNIPAIFDVVSKGEKGQMKFFVQLLSLNLPKYSMEIKRYFEAEVLFMFEIMVCFTLITEDDDAIELVTRRLIEYLESAHLTKLGSIRLSTYFFLLVRKSKENHQDQVTKIIQNILAFEQQTLSKHGSSLVQPLFSLVDNESHARSIFWNEPFWNLLRALGSVKAFSNDILTYTESVVRQSSENISNENYLPILGVLDEVSSLGAIGAQYEQDQNVRDSDEEIHSNKELILISKRSVSLTGELSSSQHQLTYPLVQALAHQCFNPCREIRSHALRILQNTISSGQLTENYTAEGLFEYGIFPLLTELQKKETLETDTGGFGETHLQVLNLGSKSFLRFYPLLPADVAENTWRRLIKNFAGINELSPEVKEPSLEVMKNMILVLQHDFLTVDKEALWQDTWTVLNKLFPGLQEEVAHKPNP